MTCSFSPTSACAAGSRTCPGEPPPSRASLSRADAHCRGAAQTGAAPAPDGIHSRRKPEAVRCLLRRATLRAAAARSVTSVTRLEGRHLAHVRIEDADGSLERRARVVPDRPVAGDLDLRQV